MFWGKIKEISRVVREVEISEIRAVSYTHLYTLVSTVVRVFFTLIALFATTGNVTLLDALTKAALPEFFACIIFAPLPHIAAKLCLHRFNKSREERTHE